MVETVARAGWNALQSAAPEDEYVHPAIIVVIEERATSPIHLDDVGVVCRITIEHGLGEAGSCTNIDEARERGSFRWFQHALESRTESSSGAKIAGRVCSRRRRVQGSGFKSVIAKMIFSHVVWIVRV